MKWTKVFLIVFMITQWLGKGDLIRKVFIFMSTAKTKASVSSPTSDKKTGWTGRSKARGFHFSIFLWVMRNGGMRGAYLFLYLVVTWFFLFDRKSNRYTRLYYRRIWKFSRFKSWRYIFKTYYSFGQCFLDKVAILSGMYKDFNVEFDGHDLLMQMAADKKGGMLISAHIGNWEIAGHFLKKTKTPVNVIMYDVERERVKKVLKDSIENRSFNMITIEEDFSHLIKIKQAIDRNEFLCAHGDRVAEHQKSKAIKADFLGRDVYIPRGPFDLANRFNLPYVFVFAIKESDKNYHFYAIQGRPESQGNIDMMVRDYLDAMGRLLKDYSDQWFNFYDYWGFDG